MAVAHVSTTAYEQTTLAASKTIASYTVSSGSDRCLVIPVAIETNSRTVSGITFNASENFVFKEVDTYAGGITYRVEWWYLVNPSVTTANIVISISGGTARFSGGIHQLTGVDQTTPLGTSVSSGAATANASVTVADGTTGDLVLDILQETAGVATVGAGQTLLYDNTGLSIAFTHGSREAGASSVAMSWTHGAAERLLSAINVFQVTAESSTVAQRIPAFSQLGDGGKMIGLRYV